MLDEKCSANGGDGTLEEVALSARGPGHGVRKRAQGKQYCDKTVIRHSYWFLPTGTLIKPST